ncbi:MAG: ATP-grasp domain-containing protein [Acidobacteria bacterium]|nr:MAG: ATP-grasp domain-containing protein [Acidobacteriota bacterium]
MSIRVAVTGVGGGVGQSILKALTRSELEVEVFAADVRPCSAGLFRAPAAILPKPEEDGALEAWASWLDEHRIAALIPGSDHDLLPLAAVRRRWAERGLCQVLVSDPELVRTCRDKAATVERLAAAGLPHPATLAGAGLEETVRWARSRYPIILKPRDGYASRHVRRIDDEEALRFFFRRTPNPLCQEYLRSPAGIEELTCSVFVAADGRAAGTFVARRQLSGGATCRAEVRPQPEVDELLRAIGESLRPRGPLNVQLRLTDRGPIPFELNVRCSGTSAVRAYFGFNEPEMLLRHYLLGESLPPPAIRRGYVLRYWNEVFLDGVGEDDLEDAVARGLRGEILPWP